MSARDELIHRYDEAMARRDHLGAVHLCHDLLAADRRDAAAWRMMSAVYLALGQDAEAQTCVKTALDLEPQDGYAWYLQGMISLRSGRVEAALQQHEQAIKCAPTRGEGYRGLAESYDQLGDTANALYYWSQAYHHGAETPEMARGFGVALMRAGQLSQAAFYLRHALELFPDWPEARMELGEILRLMNEDRDAVTELLRGLRVKQRPDGLVSLSRIHLKYREPRKALVHLNRALELAPDHGPAHHVLGLAHAGLGEWPQAIEQFTRARVVDPENLVYALDLADAHVRAGGDLDGATRLAAAVRIKSPNEAKSYFIMGWALARQERWTDAFQELEKARTLVEVDGRPVPWLADLYEQLARVYTALDDSMMSREMYARAVEADPARREAWARQARAPGA